VEIIQNTTEADEGTHASFEFSGYFLEVEDSMFKQEVNVKVPEAWAKKFTVTVNGIEYTPEA
jgi:hypothetical protein